jgi:hypothetical protein
MVREFWFKVMYQFGFATRIPKQREKSFADWWRGETKREASTEEDHEGA